MPNRIKNQAIPLYAPTETLFNEKTSICEWHEDFYPLVGCVDQSEIIIKNPEFVEEVNMDKDFDFAQSGTISSVFGSTVEDVGATFITDGVRGGMYFMNFTGGVNGICAGRVQILSVDSETQLTLKNATAGASTDYYEISWWSYVGDIRTINNFAEIKKDSPTYSESYIATPINDETNYKVQFEITYIDESAPATYILVALGTNTLVQILAEDIEEKIYTFYGVSDGTEALITVYGSCVLSIDSIQYSEMFETTFTINDCESDSVEYTSVPTDIVQSVTTEQHKMTVDWQNVSGGLKSCFGCFYVDVDQKPRAETYLERITNGDFASCSDWNLTGDVTCGSGLLAFVYNVNDATASQSNLQNNFEKGLSYNINFDMVSYDLSGVGVTIKLFSFGTLIYESDEINATGSQSINTGILTSNCDEITLSSNGDFNFTIDNLAAFYDETATEYNYRTNCFEMTSVLDCTVLLYGTNNDNAFGIDFKGLNYQPIIRVAGELQPAKFNGAKSNEEDSQGISKTLYFKSETIKSLFLYQLPMFHHEFIRLLIGYDTFKIDGVEYVALTSEYEPQNERISGKMTDLSNSLTELRLEDDKNVNKFC